MPESLMPDLQGYTSLTIELKLQGQDLIVQGTNQGKYPLWLQWLTVLRCFDNGSETKVFFGDGFPHPLESKIRLLQPNENTTLATLSDPQVVAAAQAMAGYVEVTGISLSEYVKFGQESSSDG